jgi:DNA-binding CsgD family transcriptional regulator/sugar-specific transcriptional regulator TrmB
MAWSVLESLGISSDAEDVYQLMLVHPQAVTAGIADRLGWPPQRVGIALDELADLSLVRPSWREPSVLCAVNPEAGLVSLLARKECELLEQQQQMAGARMKLSRLIDDYSELYRTRRNSYIECLTSIDEIHSRIEGLVTGCRTSIMAFAPRSARPSETMTASRPLDLAVLRRNVLTRTVYVHGLYNDRPSVDYARWLVGHGGQVRTTASLAFWMIIYDGQLALVPVDPAAESEGALLLHGTGVTSALCELFEQAWREALPFDADRERKGEEELTSQETAVLRLLAMGHTDAAVARRLGVSIRTTRRITADVMSRLGARSRFQAGFRAAELGWLDAPALRTDDVRVPVGAAPG